MRGGTAVTGTAPVEGEHAKDDKFTLKENTFTNEGYEFDGWTYGGNTYEAGAQFTMPEADVTFTAKWLELFTVTYAWDGAEKPAGAAESAALPEATEVADGKAYTLPTLAAADNYTFTGWKIGATAEVKAGGSSYTVTGDVTLTAMFVREGYYSVIYSLGDHAAADATVPTQEDTQKDAEVILAGAPAAAEGWKFAGWEVKQGESDVTVADGKFAMPEGNVTITAKWERVYAVQFLASEDATEGVSVNYVKTDKLGEGENYPVNIKNTDGFTVKEWAVKGNTSVKATADTVIETLFGSEDATLSLYPVSYHLEIGAKDHTNGYPGLEAAWNTTIQKGEKIELKGTMTSKGAENYQTVFAYLWSGETISGLFRMDNWILDLGNVGAGADLSVAEKWATIGKNPDIVWEDFKGIIANCELTITLNWVSDSQMNLEMKAVNGAKSATMSFAIAPANGQQFAENYKFGLNSESSYAEITELKKHTHNYGNDDICTVEGCNQINPVHTAHNWVKGVCSICNNICAHTTVTDSSCSVCGATLVNSSLTVDNTNWWSSGQSSDKNVTIAAGETYVFTMQYSNYAAAEWAGAIFAVRENNAVTYEIRYIDGWTPSAPAGKTLNGSVEGTNMVHNTHDNATLPESRLQVLVSLNAEGKMRIICNKYAKEDVNMENVLATRIMEITGLNVSGTVQFGISNADGSAFESNTVNVVKATYSA